MKLDTFQDHLGLHFEQFPLAALPIDLKNVPEDPEEESDDDESVDKIDSTSLYPANPKSQNIALDIFSLQEKGRKTHQM